jgi:hypothetical protein
MSMIASLENSLTFVPANAIKAPDKPLVDERTFANAAEHFILYDADLVKRFHKLAMTEMAITKIAVGSAASHEKVEFFWLDVKRDKKVIEKLRRIISQHWIKMLYQMEAAREEVGGNILAPELAKHANAIEGWIRLRRFLCEGADAEILRRKKRTILLFHHSRANAPNAE